MLGAALATLAAAAGQTENFDYSTSNIGLHRNDSFAGQVCAGATTDTSAFDLLRGRHLLIDTLQWAPFDVIDPTHPDGWSGFDIDLLQSLASILGFTYDIQDMGYPEGNETYTDLLFRRASNADLIMTYWTHTVERMATFSPLFGHVDYSGVLTSHPRAPGESTFHDRFKTFFRPFEPSLWAALLVLVMLAGFNDWTLERKAGGKLADSIYEAWAGALWGGFEYPKSRSSAIYQITLSFIMLIVVSAYTANLAAFLTIQRASSLQIGSISSLEDYDLPACTNRNDPNNAVYSRLHPGLGFKHYGTTSDGAEMLVNGTCAALIAPAIQVTNALRQPRNCQMQALETVLRSSAGWVTNRESWCVSAAINAAMQQLLLDGAVEDLFRKWLPPAQCEELAEEESGGRRLREEDAEAAAHQQARLVGRRLAASGAVAGASAGASAGGAASEDSGEDIMGVEEFSGLFVVFLGMTLSISVYAMLRHRCSDAAPPEMCAALARRLGGRVTACLDALLGEVPPGTVGSDNEAEMLRTVLQELNEIKNMVRKTNETEAKIMETEVKIMERMAMPKKLIKDSAVDVSSSLSKSKRGEDAAAPEKSRGLSCLGRLAERRSIKAGGSAPRPSTESNC